MLLRRVRQRAGRRDPVCIGTSATIVTDGDRTERRARIAEAGRKLFGFEVPPDHVVEETLQRVATVPVPEGREALAAAVRAEPPAPGAKAVRNHPLVAWVEATFGLAVQDERLVRRTPLAFEEGVQRLVEATGSIPELCRARLRAVLEAGNAATLPSGEPVPSGCTSSWPRAAASMRPSRGQGRALSTEGQVYAPRSGEGEPKLLYRSRSAASAGRRRIWSRGSASTRRSGWCRARRCSMRPRTRSPARRCSSRSSTIRSGVRARTCPMAGTSRAPGSRASRNATGSTCPSTSGCARTGWSVGCRWMALEGWLQPKPLMLCLRCRASYDLRETSDFRKLVTLSQTGRSTATTVVATAAIAGLRSDAGIEPEARKLLSFTDNRQDAALQAGHMNDFVQVVLLRGALVRALEERGELRFDELGSAVFGALGLAPELFMKEAVGRGPAGRPAHDDRPPRVPDARGPGPGLAGRPAEPRAVRAPAHRLPWSRRARGRRDAVGGRAGDRRGDAGTA